MHIADPWAKIVVVAVSEADEFGTALSEQSAPRQLVTGIQITNEINHSVENAESRLDVARNLVVLRWGRRLEQRQRFEELVNGVFAGEGEHHTAPKEVQAEPCTSLLRVDGRLPAAALDHGELARNCRARQRGAAIEERSVLFNKAFEKLSVVPHDQRHNLLRSQSLVGMPGARGHIAIAPAEIALRIDEIELGRVAIVLVSHKCSVILSWDDPGGDV
jgi:hypothetical protein